MNRVPDIELVKIPGGSLITQTPEEGRALAFAIARHTVHNIQPDLDVLVAGRAIFRFDGGRSHRRPTGSSSPAARTASSRRTRYRFTIGLVA
jgi:hypothetical protein